MKQMQKRNHQEITAGKKSNDSQLYWKKQFQNNLLYFNPYADFEGNNEVDTPDMSNKTNNIYRQNLVYNGYGKVSELNDILQNGYYRSPLRTENWDWFVDEV